MDSLIHTRLLTLKRVTACLILWPQSWELRAALLILGIGTDKNRASLRNRKQHAGLLLLNAPWHHCCFYTCFRTSWAWHKDAVLLCCVQRCTVKYTRAQPPVEDARMWQCTPDTWTTLHDRACRHTVASLQVHNFQVRMQGTYSRGISESLCSIVETNTTL